MKPFAFVSMLLCSLSVQAAVLTSGSINDALHAAGYERTRTCLRDGSDYGVRRIWTIQYHSHGEPREQAGALMGKIAASLEPTVRFLAFAPRRAWSKCSERGKQFVFWRDESYNWRLVQGSPIAYLQRQHARLEAEQLQTAQEAYVLFSLATVQHGSGNVDDAIATYERILELPETARSNELRVLTLFQLSQIFLERDDHTGAVPYLQEYALATSSVIKKIDQMPIVRPFPRYPLRARESFSRGSVLLSFDVNTKGVPENITILHESPPRMGFGKAAADAVEKSRYVPAVRNGQLVTATGIQRNLEFSLTTKVSRLHR